MMDIREEMLVVLEERFGIARSSVSDESRIQEDLDLDSIDLFDIISLIEKRTGATVDISEFIRARTFGDFLQVVEALIAKAPAT